MENKPKFTPTDEGQSVKINKFVKDGENQYGPWWLYDVTNAKGEEMSWFVTKEWQKKEIDGYVGKTIVVQMEAKLSKDGKPYKQLRIIGEAVPNSETGTPVEPEPNIKTNGQDYAKYWEEQRDLLARCIHTVMEARKILGDYAPEDSTEGIFTPDAIQKYAVSLYIEYKRRT